MDKLNFYLVNKDYVKWLSEAELKKRGFSRIPRMDYEESQKPKFLCGVVLRIRNIDYYVPVTSYKKRMPDNFLIKAKNGETTSSLRFNYMFPIPKDQVMVRSIDDEPDRAYRALLSQELRYCIKNQDKILQRAKRTYRKVYLRQDPVLMRNSCDFPFLEKKCREYARQQTQSVSINRKRGPKI